MPYVDVYCIYRLVQASGTTYDGVKGWGGMLTFMWTCGSSWCYAHAGWGGVGWDVNVHVNLRQDVNVHVNLRQQLMLRTRGVGGWGGMLTFMWTCSSMLTFMWTCGSSWWWCVMMMMLMMMIMTLMKLVNSATKFRHGMDKFYQPNSGLRSSRSLDEAIYTYIYIY